jgi:hypothetical protein
MWRAAGYARMPSKKEQYKYAKHAAPRPGDERFGAFTQAELAKMDQRFVERMEWALRTGREQMRERAGIIRAQRPTER